MTEVPEHLLKRSAERRAALGAPPAGGGAAADPSAPATASDAGASDAPADDGSKIPAHLLARSQAAKEAAGGGSPATTGAAATAAAATAVATAPAPVAKGPEGHTQRLLTVVKAGSIQDVKATPTDKVHTWPHLLIGEFIACLSCSAFLLVFSAVVNAPFLAAANFNFTPNPSKAPWYFLGLQELLTMFHPMVAGVTIPGIGIFGLMLAPYIDKNPSQKPEDRKFAISLFTLFFMFWAVLVIIGTLFRGPGFNFTFPWRDGVFFDL
ncbi:MAG: Ubiquinol--cytochrome c reductase, cytochrome B subunit [uncultured Acidimicrobiales bacterium]|uniref:Ubiquinol--cytochrome c reductase, cytochrome B subunit n=1 Tax=uncultured Acidimicrobiales bacterium TaxID=310071 RepID=A0A6J4I8M0_9ACTN|nr:MAG: Ubiquinol--cytochrome c reductase, cytochrome B subunit [uncultured Acidimicrobiales bacterium]